MRIDNDVNVDNILTDEIFKKFAKQVASFDSVNIDKKIRAEYEKNNELDKYELIAPNHVAKSITLGDIIKFTKKDTYQISCASIVKHIKYIYNNKNIIDYISLTTNNANHIWRIYPANHFIYRLNRHGEDRNVIECLKKYVSETVQTKGTKMIVLTPAIKKTLFGPTFSYIDNECDRIISDHNKQTNMAIYTGTSDQVIDKIIEKNYRPTQKIRKSKK
jgi:hypothetical protein